jgi:predicted RNase H-like nuclease
LNQGSSTRNSLVAGADGCPGGWICVTARVEGAQGRLGLLDAVVLPDFAALLRQTRDCAAVAVDIPIGLSADGRREADFEARRRIGPRRSSVFPAPARMLLDVPTYAEANALSYSRLGKGLPAQAFGIISKIREADSNMTQVMQARVVESHPEVSFWALSGDEPLLFAKRTREGAEERLRPSTALLSWAFHYHEAPQRTTCMTQAFLRGLLRT